MELYRSPIEIIEKTIWGDIAKDIMTVLIDELPHWLRQCRQSFLLKKVVGSEVLRKWSLSEVLRLALEDGSTIIAKIGKEPMAAELNIYNDILKPCNVKAPAILESFYTEFGNIILMEDLGFQTIEETPQYHHFIEAAHQLARIRLLVSDHIGRNSVSPVALQRHFMPKEQFLEDSNFLLTRADPTLAEYKEIFLRIPHIMGKNLDLLYSHYPLTITHNDYHSKNLIIHHDRIIPIDWSSAYLSPHLGDLYCIAEEALDYDIDKAEIVNAYFSETSEDDTKDSQWQMAIGGLCWEIHTLRWIVEFGIHVIPGSEDWISSFVKGIQNIIDEPTLL